MDADDQRLLGACFYASDRAKILLYDPQPALVVLVRADAEPAKLAAQLRRLANEIEAGAALPELRTDDAPPLIAYIAEEPAAAALSMSLPAQDVD